MVTFQERPSAHVMMRFPGAVSDARGTFQPQAMAQECADGSWEGWLEFVPVGGDPSNVQATPIETHQHDRATMERWASGLTRVYAEGALARARAQAMDPPVSPLLSTLQELVEALDRRIPDVERAGEAQIAADANRLRAAALHRIALVNRRNQSVPTAAAAKVSGRAGTK